MNGTISENYCNIYWDDEKNSSFEKLFMEERKTENNFLPSKDFFS